MPFSKSEMQEELFKFLSQFGKDIANLYGVDDYAWTERKAIQESPIWKAASEMYDYGVMGISSENLHPEGHIDGVYARMERFLRAMDTPQMRLYLEESNNTPPRLALLAVQSAVARMVLDGGWRHTDYGAGENGALKGDMNHLTLAEVALLANMDERSVRNAANPKLPDPLKTEQVGKRSLVSPEEARRWLAGRKGYIPTRAYAGPRRPSIDVTLPVLPEEFLDQIQRAAAESGVSATKILGEQFLANLHAAIKAGQNK
ncbi:hypothetical protein [Cognatazoarcus halotolerans]|uniref:hypothetical protein n=1 Tax=Cognatazoarcus halotolerans TaxID=2686016 RepID=UPI001357EC1D|nr:hypothetical protein [Cognatazoarcus halotolerans]